MKFYNFIYVKFKNRTPTEVRMVVIFGKRRVGLSEWGHWDARGSLCLNMGGTYTGFYKGKN